MVEPGGTLRQLFPLLGKLFALIASSGWLILVLHSGPSDGTVTRPATFPHSRWADGIELTSVFGPTSLRPGDLVLAVDGTRLDTDQPAIAAGPSHRAGDRLAYLIRRDGAEQVVDVVLTPYPLASAARKVWPMLAFQALSFLLAAFVLRRLADRAARVLATLVVIMPFGLTGWPFSMQVIDLVGGRGWWPQLVGSVGWALVWLMLVHFALLFPLPPAVRHPRLAVASIYLMLPVLYAGYLAIALPSAHGALPRLERLLSVSNPPQLLTPAVILALVVWSYRRTTEPDAKRRVKWVLRMLVLAAGASIFLDVLPSALLGRSYYIWPLEPLLYLLCTATVVAGIFRHRLFDIRVILRRSLLYASLTVLVAALFLATVVLLDSLVASPPPIVALMLGALVGAGFWPLRAVLNRSIGLRVFGQRDDPLAVVSRLAGLDNGGLPQQVLSALLESLTHGLRLAFAQIELRTADGTVLADVRHGTPQTVPVAVPLSGIPDVEGRLLLDAGEGAEPFGAADAELLDTIAVHVSAAAHTAVLADALQRARERLVTAGAEQRRRLQRDLHDGVGPTLAAVALQAQSAAELLDADPVAARKAVGVVAEQTTAALAEIRRIVHELRPPSLDQLGLVETLRERAASFRLPVDAAHPLGFDARISVDGELERLPAAVEFAAFSIVMEALNNCARHATATRCDVRLWQDGALHLEIADDGRGMDFSARRGLGLDSMLERAAELGGRCVIDSGLGRGTVIRARLPVTRTTEVAR